METIKIAAVSYLNTFPFVFGIKTSGELDDVELHLHVPSVCAAKLAADEVDLALVPAGALPDIPDHRIITDYCIGAEADVKTVLLLSQVPVNEIGTIHLDADSRTSVALVKVLARDHWKIAPQYVDLLPGQAQSSTGVESLVAIGDKTFSLAPHYPYVYDLAGEWIRHTSLPFVFAVWASRKDLPEGFVLKFNKSLGYGISRIQEIPVFFRNQIPKGVNAVGYLENNISYPLTARKREGLERFLQLITKDKR